MSSPISSISSISSSQASSSVYGSDSSFASSRQKVGQDFRALGTALKSGDLSAAQKAYAQLQADMPTPPSGSTATSSSSNPFTSALNAIGQALSSGNVSAAQQAFGQLQGAHGHHHHHGGGSSSTSASQSSPTSVSSSSVADALSSTGGTLNVVG